MVENPSVCINAAIAPQNFPNNSPWSWSTVRQPHNRNVQSDVGLLELQWNIRMRNNWISMWNTRGTQSRDSPLPLCRSGTEHTTKMGEMCDTWSYGNAEKQMRKHLSHNVSPVPSLLSEPSLAFSHWRRVFAVSGPVNPISSPPLSSSSLLFLLCPSHPLVLTPEQRPLKSPGNKLWCLSSSLLSRSPHPSSPSDDTSAVKVSLLQKSRPPPLCTVQESLSDSNVPPILSLSPFPPFFAALVLCVPCAARCGCTVPEKPAQTHTHTCMSTHTQSQTHSWAPAAYKDWGLEINEGERRKGERSLNKLALEKRRKMRKREWRKQGARRPSLKDRAMFFVALQNIKHRRQPG